MSDHDPAMVEAATRAALWTVYERTKPTSPEDWASTISHEDWEQAREVARAVLDAVVPMIRDPLRGLTPEQKRIVRLVLAGDTPLAKKKPKR